MVVRCDRFHRCWSAKEATEYGDRRIGAPIPEEGCCSALELGLRVCDYTCPAGSSAARASCPYSGKPISQLRRKPPANIFAVGDNATQLTYVWAQPGQRCIGIRGYPKAGTSITAGLAHAAIQQWCDDQYSTSRQITSCKMRSLLLQSTAWNPFGPNTSLTLWPAFAKHVASWVPGMSIIATVRDPRDTTASIWCWQNPTGCKREHPHRCPIRYCQRHFVQALNFTESLFADYRAIERGEKEGRMLLLFLRANQTWMVKAVGSFLFPGSGVLQHEATVRMISHARQAVAEVDAGNFGIRPWRNVTQQEQLSEDPCKKFTAMLHPALILEMNATLRDHTSREVRMQFYHSHCG
jgi:hypothetical protein